ncbi:hypothetical protein P153DRAFT_358831 [Dothidotthia symphoricarpi CBS 119687]|uniref:Uncharacterized protein n=1 Tax=Dothidotthia symphoricarpi CBS 119687 TaxID=1392245 RepID=A0A6A6A7S2_9PLEO|nr:uncharacterized protein P153DRAFT_358831 [Dothidotthia symphoricarpi CBS 119687]KAF2127213.1 hypothetical protein P153DRAFT_358831 [Dothidotthia symphoricarpi CBS 119687]
MAGARIRAPQDSATPTAQASSTPTAAQPTITLALSTTFTPPAQCTANRITILPPPGYFMWANEPVPYPNTTVSDCYPSEFLRSYTSMSAGATGSSIVPVMSPLVCPQNFCTMFAADNNYIACCPSDYKFAPPSSIAVSSRPAYGGTCYSDFTVSSTLTALKYNSEGSTGTEPWIASKTGIQAYAHPIDGFAPHSPSLGCALNTSSHSKNTTSTSLPASSSSSSPAQTPTPSHTPSPGAIAGAVLGALVGLILLLTLILFLLRRHRRNTTARMDSNQETHQLSDDFAGGKPHETDAGNARYEKDSAVAAAEIGSSGGMGKYGVGGVVHEMDGGRGAEGVHELAAEREGREEGKGGGRLI